MGVPPRPPLQDWNGRQAWDSDRRVTVNNTQVMLVCVRPGDRGGGTETRCLGAKGTKCRPGTPGILKYVSEFEGGEVKVMTVTRA